MNEANELLETLVDTQKKSIETFVDTTTKFQEAVKSGKAIEKTTEICKDWWNSQLELLNEITSGTKNETEKTANSSQNMMEDFYKNLFDNQVSNMEKAAEFNLNFFNSVSNFGKKSNETNEQFHSIQENWNSLFESWTTALNSSYGMLNKSLPTNFNPDLFQSIFNTNTLYSKLQDFYKPYFTAIKENNFSAENLKTLLDPTEYKKITEESFKLFFQDNGLNSLVDSNIKFVQDYFANHQNSSKEHKEFWKVFTDKFPHLISQDYTKISDVYKNISTSYRELFAPMLHFVSNVKEKENFELVLDTLDKSSNYGVQLSKIQNLLYSTGQKASGELFASIFDKSKQQDFSHSFQNFFNEWASINEKHYTSLFATDEFSKLKAELLTLSLAVNKNIEKQFENRVEFLPLVVKSELNELYKTIYDLKKTVKSLESKYNATAATATTAATSAKKETDQPATAATKTANKKVNA